VARNAAVVGRADLLVVRGGPALDVVDDGDALAGGNRA
jgi:hypothetical protein